ncbi:Holliday junction ATP-dependent DNA helicase RuvA [bacterium BMS3Abin02]|nr:Holliday junction ATP-dependent DNA helicase RuvA [bacterium BMS3Abin02]HDK45936.1 Holliday junction branch migration protein RuvA [Actinomycetota bacterium]HDL48364.1 Holliday junction branch migration protein RuvA [Actinomycetota bacterium]
MIAGLSGTVVASPNDRVILQVGGIGFEIRVTPGTRAEIGRVGTEATLHTHLHVREDALDLYGFTAAGDRDLFRLLLTASGIGPKVAMAMMGALTTDEIRRAVVTEDAVALTVVPGIGMRSAQKLILELRPKLAGAEADVMGGATLSRVREALEGLGYAAGEIQEVVGSLPADAPIEDNLRAALKTLGRT